MIAQNIADPISEGIHHLPARRYLENSLGTLVNDGLYELAKFRNKEKNPENNTANCNLKWLARYLLDNAHKVKLEENS